MPIYLPIYPSIHLFIHPPILHASSCIQIWPYEWYTAQNPLPASGSQGEPSGMARAPFLGVSRGMLLEYWSICTAKWARTEAEEEEEDEDDEDDAKRRGENSREEKRRGEKGREDMGYNSSSTQIIN